MRSCWIGPWHLSAGLPSWCLGSAAGAVCFSAIGDIVGARSLERRQTHLVEGMRRYVADPVHNSPLYVPDDPQDFSEVERVSERGH